jgi:hypothetical protein
MWACMGAVTKVHSTMHSLLLPGRPGRGLQGSVSEGCSVLWHSLLPAKGLSLSLSLPPGLVSLRWGMCCWLPACRPDGGGGQPAGQGALALA